MTPHPATPQLLVVVLGSNVAAIERSSQALAAQVKDVPVVVQQAPDMTACAAMVELAPFVVVILAGDVPAPTSVPAILEALQRRPDLDVLYGDEDQLDAGGLRIRPFHKPAWSPERLWCQDYLGSMVLYRSTIFAAVLSADVVERSADASAQVYDLHLAATVRAAVIGHLPRVLCHRTRRESIDQRGRLAALQRHFDRLGIPARSRLFDNSGAGDGSVDVPLLGFEPELGAGNPLVSIIIPTGGSTRTVRGAEFVLVDNAIQSLITNSTYQHIEIVVVVDAKSTQALADRLAALDERVRIVKDHRPFNFSAACNAGVAASTGAVVVLLNDDTEVVTPAWIERLITLLTLDDVGAVGVKLLYADGRLQHGGVLSRATGPGHLYHGYPADDCGHGDWLLLTLNCFAATGACLAVRRDHWDAVGGMDEAFPLNYNDIDLCLRLRQQGWRTVVDNQTTLRHLETSSRSAGSEDWEVDAFRGRWNGALDIDPYDNPNLSPVGRLQIPRPRALTELTEYRGRDDHAMRIWTAAEGFEVAETVSDTGPGGD